MPLGHAIHCSSNAPVNYFDAPAEVSPYIFQKKPEFKEPVYRGTTWFWDGAVSGFNNPVLAALVEATTNGADPKNCCILSIGTGTGNKAILTDVGTSNDPADIAKFKANKGNQFVITDPSASLKADIKKMATSILDDPPDSATFIAYSFMDPSLSGNANLVRINPCYSPEYDKATSRFVIPKVYQDEEQRFLSLLKLDMDAVETPEIDLIKDLCKRFITESENCLQNQLVRGDISGEKIGYPTYKAAKLKWKTCI